MLCVVHVLYMCSTCAVHVLYSSCARVHMLLHYSLIYIYFFFIFLQSPITVVAFSPFGKYLATASASHLLIFLLLSPSPSFSFLLPLPFSLSSGWYYHFMGFGYVKDRLGGEGSHEERHVTGLQL